LAGPPERLDCHKQRPASPLVQQPVQHWMRVKDSIALKPGLTQAAQARANLPGLLPGPA